MEQIDTTDLTSYKPGYDDYCEPKEDYGECPEEDIDTIIDEKRLEELEERRHKVAEGTTNVEKEGD